MINCQLAQNKKNIRENQRGHQRGQVFHFAGNLKNLVSQILHLS